MQTMKISQKKIFFNPINIPGCLTCLFCFVFCCNVFAQNITVRGQVSDQQGGPLSGVSVNYKGTNTGTTTDAGGRFSLTIPRSGTLVFSSVSFTAEEVALNGRTNINVVLNPESQVLNNVVVTALGIKREK